MTLSGLAFWTRLLRRMRTNSLTSAGTIVGCRFVHRLATLYLLLTLSTTARCVSHMRSTTAPDAMYRGPIGSVHVGATLFHSRKMPHCFPFAAFLVYGFVNTIASNFQTWHLWLYGSLAGIPGAGSRSHIVARKPVNLMRP